MTDIGDEPKHKPSAKHTLEEVRKSLEDLVRNEFIDTAPAQDAETSAHSDKPPPLAPAPPQRSRQRLQTMQKQNLATSQVLQSLNELIGNDLSDTAGANDQLPAAADVDVRAHEPDHTGPTDQEMSARTESLESLAAELAVDDADVDIEITASGAGDSALDSQDLPTHAESLEALAGKLAVVDEDDPTPDAADALELSDTDTSVGQIPWDEFSKADTNDVYAIPDNDAADDSDAAIDLTADLEINDASTDEITLEDTSLEEPLTNESPRPISEDTDAVASATATSDSQAIEFDLDAPADATTDADVATPDPAEITLATTPDDASVAESLDDPALPPHHEQSEWDSNDTTAASTEEEIELSVDESANITTAAWDADGSDAPTSDAQPSAELSLADDGPGLDLTSDTAMDSSLADAPKPTNPQESIDDPDADSPTEPEAQQTFDFEMLAASERMPETATASAEREQIDETRPKEPYETAEIPDDGPRQVEDSELRFEDPKSTLVEPAGERVPLAPDEELSMELGAELEAPIEASSSTDTADIDDDSPTLSPMDALEIPGEEASPEAVAEENQVAMQNSGHEHSSTIGREASDATTVVLAPEQAQPADHEHSDEPTVELDQPEVEQQHEQPVSEGDQTAADKVAAKKKPGQSGAKPTPVVTLSDDKPVDGTSTTPTASPKSKIFTVASSGEAKELSMPGIDFDVGAAAGKAATDTGTESKPSAAAGNSSPDDSEYIDLAVPAPTDKQGYKRTPWPTPSALFRQDSTPTTKQVGMATRTKGSPQTIENQHSLAKPKVKTKQGAETIPVLSEVIDRPTQPKKPKKKPAPLAAPKIASPGAGRKKQHKQQALGSSSTTPKAGARNVAVNVIAKLNMELRKCGERALSPVTIDRLQFLLREALERYAKDVENGPKRR